VRVEQILPLASYSLAANRGAIERVTAALDNGKTTFLPLERKLPVYFLYWTAFMKDGELVSRPDIYGRDHRLIAAMKMPVLRIAAAGDCQRR
jgi:murein L,D-transpeptidase YcbB/YkuD